MRRQAEPRDFLRVFDIYMHERVVPFLGHDPMPMESFREVFGDLLKTEAFYVYELSGRVVGFYTARRLTGRARHVAQLGTLATDPAFHGSPLAEKMVTDAVKRLAADGVKRIELLVESDNPRGIRFYKKLGFVQEATLRAYYQRAGEEPIDEYLMRLML